MTRIESEKKEIPKPAPVIFAFLSDFRNFNNIMPEQVTDWQATADECSFTIKGMASLGMKIAERKPNEQITIIKNEKGPFDFSLHCLIAPLSDSASQLQLAFEADLNPMLKLMVEKPLRHFLNLLVDRYAGLK